MNYTNLVVFSTDVMVSTNFAHINFTAASPDVGINSNMISLKCYL